MPRAIVRFLAGALAGVAAGMIAFRSEVLRPASPAFQCVLVGALFAFLLGAVRRRAFDVSVLMVAVFATYQAWAANAGGLGAVISTALWCVVIGSGLAGAAVIYELLHLRGVRLGKFLLMGPLVAGVYMAATPLTLLATNAGTASLRMLLFNIGLGLVIGDGVAFGVEIVDLSAGERGSRRDASFIASAENVATDAAEER